ncbi:MAG: AraC family transcriptional regulator [Bacteroidota bacterium]
MKPFTIKKPATETFNSKRIIAGVEVTNWLFNGIEIIYFDGLISQETELHWDSDKDGIVMCFNLLGKSTFKDKDQSYNFEFSNNQHNTFYCKEAKGQILFEKSILKTFIIKLSQKSFFEICSIENNVLKEFNKRISKENSTTLFSQNLNIDFLIQTCISSILNCKYENSLKRIFLFSKVAEIVVLQLESFKNTNDKQKAYIKTDYDKERIFYAKEYLLKNIESPPSLKQLARISGINEFKLKKGFKELFNQTVYEYLSDVRLEIGKNDLLEKRKTISQIAFELGYSSLQHFSNSFKRKFGVSPNQVR